MEGGVMFEEYFLSKAFIDVSLKIILTLVIIYGLVVGLRVTNWVTIFKKIAGKLAALF